LTHTLIVKSRVDECGYAGTEQERIVPSDADHGVLWRLQSYFRYSQTADGVLIEMESLTLSRGIPLLVRPVAGPIVDHVARESAARTLQALAARFESGGAPQTGGKCKPCPSSER